MFNRRKLKMWWRIRRELLYQIIIVLAVLGATIYIISKIWPLNNVYG